MVLDTRHERTHSPENGGVPVSTKRRGRTAAAIAGAGVVAVAVIAGVSSLLGGKGSNETPSTSPDGDASPGASAQGPDRRQAFTDGGLCKSDIIGAAIAKALGTDPQNLKSAGGANEMYGFDDKCVWVGPNGLAASVTVSHRFNALGGDLGAGINNLYPGKEVTVGHGVEAVFDQATGLHTYDNDTSVDIKTPANDPNGKANTLDVLTAVRTANDYGTAA